jgi:hypothetical protein
MADDTHNHIEGDFVIKNSDGIEKDYSFVNNRYKTPVGTPIKAPMMLFRLLVPGPSNLRGRSIAYQVDISRG